MSLQKWTIRFPSLMSFAFIHSSRLPLCSILLFSSYHNIQIFFTLMATVNDRVGGRLGRCVSAVVKSWEKVNAGTAVVKDGLWVLLVRLAECLFYFFFGWDDRPLFHMCNSAQFPGYKQTLPGCMLVWKGRGSGEVTEVKTKEGGGGEWRRRKRRRRRGWGTKRMRRRKITTEEMVTDGEGHVLLPA